MKFLLVVALVAVFGSCLASAFKSNLNLDKSALKAVVQKAIRAHGINLKDDFDANAYVDEVLDELQAYIKDNNLDPYKVEDIDFLGLHTTGYIAGFSTVTRVGDATVTDDGVTLNLNVNLGIFELEGDFNWTYTFLGLTYNGQADAILDEADFTLVAHGPIVAGSDYTELTLDSLDIYYEGRVSVEVTGFGIFDELIDIVADIVGKLMLDILPGIIDDIVGVVLQIVFDNLPCPVPT